MSRNSTAVVVPGTTFANLKASSFSRPTAMSIALEKAGIVNERRYVRELTLTGVVRNQNDNKNIRPSSRIAF